MEVLVVSLSALRRVRLALELVDLFHRDFSWWIVVNALIPLVNLSFFQLKIFLYSRSFIPKVV